MDRIGQLLGLGLRGGEILALSGELGTGKTTLVRGVARGLGVPSRKIASPSFVLIQPHHGRLPLAHADFYRLETDAQVHDLGLTEYMDGQWVVAVEWAEKVLSDLPPDRLDIHLAHHTPSTRDAAFVATGPRSRRLLKQLVSLARSGGGKARVQQEPRKR